MDRFGTVPKATHYVLKVYSPNGATHATHATVDLPQSQPYQSFPETGGAWTYSVEAQYRVPGSTNVWISAGPRQTVNC